MSRTQSVPLQRDLTAQANEISEIKRQFGVADNNPPAALRRASVAPPSGDGEAPPPPSPTGSSAASITVAVRKRPRIKGREDDQNDVVRCGRSGSDETTDGCSRAEDGGGQITVYAPKMKVDLTPVIEPSNFTFDHVFDTNSDNRIVYEMTTQPLLRTVKEGGSAVVFAFGQTGSGKTFTMLGSGNDSRNAGLYSQAIVDVFDLFGATLNLVVSFYEVYGTKCFDLLNDRNEVRVMQDEYKNVHVVGIVERTIRTPEDMMKLMDGGSILRSSGTTHANDRSSRSHAVLVLNLRTPKHGALYSRMTFVDLAGSERASDTTDTDKKTRREGAEINKSLLALKECIRAMGMKKRHVPFRGSKLTQILRESFIGNCSTCVIANVSPCHDHSEDTLNTLRYADRIKELKTDGLQDAEPIPCANCGAPIFPGDRHLCRRVVAQCPHCRISMDKDLLQAHLLECKEAPSPCPHCGTRVLQGDVAKHEKKCMRLPIKCPLCSSLVARESMPRHQRDHCPMTKVACRYCRAQFPRAEVSTHEEECPSMQVVCGKCLMPMKRGRLEAHTLECRGGRGVANVGGGGSNGLLRAVSRGPSPSAPTTGRVQASNGPGAAVGSGPHAVAQLRNQHRRQSLRQSVPPPNGSTPQDEFEDEHRSATAYGIAGHVKSPMRVGPGLLAPREAFSENPSPPSVPPIQGFPRRPGVGGKAITSQSSGRLAAAGGGAAEPCQYCGRRILGEAMSSHIANDCSYVPLPCSFAKFGCKALVHKLHLTTHLQEHMASHLEMVLRYAEDVSRENDDLRYLLNQEANAESEPPSGKCSARSTSLRPVSVPELASSSGIDGMSSLSVGEEASSPVVQPIPSTTLVYKE